MELILLDNNLNVSHMPIDDFLSLTWKKNWTECGTFSLYLSGEYFDAVKSSRYLYQSEEQDTAIIENVAYTDNSGRVSFYAKGRHLNALLYDCVIPKTETLRGNLETKIRALVKKYAIDDSTQKVPKLQLGELQGYTESVDTQVTGTELGEALYTILSPYGMSWNLRYDFENDVVCFDIVKGKDRTQDQTENTWATFSTSRENIRSTEYTYNDSDYKNFAYVAGSGEGNSRTVVEVDESHGEKIRALYVDARDLQKEEEDTTQDMFVLCGWDGMLATSTNSGSTWNLIQTSTGESFFGTAYVNGRYLVCGTNGTVAVSDDGTTWNCYSTGTSATLEGACYYNGVYIVYGNNSIIKYSYDGQTWYDAAVPITGAYIRKIIWARDQFVGICYDGTILLSPDGVNWKTTSPTGKVASTCISYYRGVYVITNYSGTIQTTKDLKTLHTVDFGNTYSVEGVAHGNGTWVIVGRNGIIYTSQDTILWTHRTSGTTTELVGVEYGQGYFVAAARFTGDKIVLKSKDGITWTRINVSSDININGISFGTDFYKYTLRLRGLEKLKGYEKVDEASGAADNASRPIYGADYEIGDVCDFENGEICISFQERVNGVEIVYEPRSARKITPMFGTSYLTMKNYIKREANK